VKPTRVSLLLALAVLAGLVTYLALQVAYSSMPPLPGYAPFTLFLVAIAEAWYALAVRARVRKRRRGLRPMDPLLIARLAVVGKATAHAGALIAGGYAGIFAFTSRNFDKPQVASDGLVSGLSFLAAALLVVVALLLEHSCRIPPSKQDRDSHDKSASRR
jgi:hypothetical protein